MTNRNNPRRNDQRRTEHGPHFENHNRADAQHVAKARKGWKNIANRSERRTGSVTPKFMSMSSGGHSVKRHTTPKEHHEEETTTESEAETTHQETEGDLQEEAKEG